MKDIKIARAVRNYPGGIVEVTLVWKVFSSKLCVEYRQLNDAGTLQQTISDGCVREWLLVFTRDQRRLQDGSYYIVDPPCKAWQEIIEGIVKHV